MKSGKIIDSNGVQRWYEEDRLHRDGDEPAVVYPNGNRVYYSDGDIHRDVGPAVVRVDGYQAWYTYGALDREVGAP